LRADEHDIAAAMKKDMFKLYPQLKGHIKTEAAWSGLLCYAPHKMPLIQERAPGYWCNTGFGGHGLCPTTVGGEIVAKAIAEGDDGYKAFAPFGLGFAGGKTGRYVAQMVYLWWRLRDFIET
ncbi:MAG: FAD-dependent oxidoreductase, partial [Alphaproteobacteria bacterium]|nr:FAD-dependent oxidoreductase [Alphaproteobacteria bacterium]